MELNLSADDDNCPAYGSVLKVENLGEFYCRSCETGWPPPGSSSGWSPLRAGMRTLEVGLLLLVAFAVGGVPTVLAVAVGTHRVGEESVASR